MTKAAPFFTPASSSRLPVRTGDTERNRKAEPGSMRLGRIERFEDSRLLVSRNAGPAIRNANAHTAFPQFDAKRHYPARIADLKRIFEQIQQSAGKRLSASDDYSAAGIAFPAEANTPLRAEGLHGLRGIGQKLIDRDRFATDLLATRKQEHVLNQAFETAQLFRCLAGKTRPRLIREIGLGQVGAVEQRSRQRSTQLVRKGGRHFAHGCEALVALHAGFHFVRSGNVVHKDDPAPGRGQPAFGNNNAPAGENELVRRRRQLHRCGKLLPVPTGRYAAEHRTGSRIGRTDSTILFDDDDPGRQRVEQQPKALGKRLLFLVLAPQLPIGDREFVGQGLNAPLQCGVGLRQFMRDLIEDVEGPLQVLCLR